MLALNRLVLKITMEATIDAKVKAVEGQLGITLEGVRKLRAECSESWTTAELATHHVMQVTQPLPNTKRNWVFLEDGKYCDKFKYFISHTWGASAAMLLDAIIVHGERVGGNPAYYLDIVSEDQHVLNQVSAI